MVFQSAAATEIGRSRGRTPTRPAAESSGRFPERSSSDYLVKPFAPDELIARLRRLLARTSGKHENGRRALTAREEEVLKLLAGGLAQNEIAKELVISEKTVASHIERILAKLGVHSRAQAVTVAYQTGLC